MRWIKRIVIGTLSLVFVLVALALIVPFLIPTSTYKDQIETRVKAATGRDLKLGGALKLSILPSIELSARDVVFGNRPGAAQSEMMRLKGLDLKLKLGPLLSGRFEIDALELVEPDIILEVDKDGKPNWQFDKPAGAAPSPPSDATKTPPPPPKPGQAAQPLPSDMFNTLQIAELSIVRGRVRYSDARTGAKYDLDKANLVISLPGGQRAFRVEGDAEYKGKHFAFKTEIKSPTDVINGGSSPFASEFGVDRAKFTFSGTAQGGQAPKMSGALKIDVPSVRDLAAWVGSPMPAGKGFGPLNLSAAVAGSSEGVTLKDLVFKFDEISATGELAYVFGVVPTLRGTLSIPGLNLNPYLGASAPAAAPAPGKPEPAAPPPPPAASATPPPGIDPAPMRTMNVDLKIDARKIEVNQFRADQALLGVKLADGILVIGLERVLLYKGTATGAITVNGARTPLTVNPNVEVKGLDGHALLVAIGAGDRISGTLNAAVNLTGTGADAKAIQNSLNGTARFQFANGALRGYNFAGMFRAIGDTKNPLEIVQQVKKAVESLNKFDGAQRTDFSELSGSFRATNSVFATSDLRMAAPLVRVEGQGTISLPANATDMRLLVRAVPTLQGQGSEFAKLGIPIPLRVHGPFANLSYGLDEKALGDEITKKAPDLIKDQILKKPGDIIKKPGDIIKKPGGILDNFRR